MPPTLTLRLLIPQADATRMKAETDAAGTTTIEIRTPFQANLLDRDGVLKTLIDAEQLLNRACNLRVHLHLTLDV